MLHELMLDKYPIFTLNIAKTESRFQNVDEIVAYLLEQIDAHPIATFIAIFDHYGHTCTLPSGEINSDIHAGKNIIFCFGEKLPNPKMLALRPRSIGVVDYQESFVISFLEAPMAPMNDVIQQWVKAIKNA